jgi:hypothetical protein
MRVKTLAGTALLVLSSQAVAEPFFLSCDLEFQYDGKKMNVDFKIDEEKKTVDIYPATFTETSISYDVKLGDGGVYSTVFSRLTGRVRVSSEKNIVAQGTCAISNTRKF